MNTHAAIIPGVVISILQPTAAAHLIIEPILPGSLILSQMIVKGILCGCVKHLFCACFLKLKIPFKRNQSIK